MSNEWYGRTLSTSSIATLCFTLVCILYIFSAIIRYLLYTPSSIHDMKKDIGAISTTF
ncbi:hypothetical protein BD408DRAFT_417769 [Parasitella parasitica]|nr:hypothetical protein BD408DRAFT_417769 [Parasitella parasitica]